MNTALAALELTGFIDQNQKLRVDRILPIIGPKRVRVIVLYDIEDDWSESEWLHAVAQNPVFADLADPSEDIYTLADGQPIPN